MNTTKLKKTELTKELKKGKKARVVTIFNKETILETIPQKHVSK